jgi:uncharacterized protein
VQVVRIPTVKECYALMKCYTMLPNIVAHSEQVARVAAAIMDHLKDGSGISREAVIAACLLHDITKTRSLKTREHHDISGRQLLAELGFSAIGAMVEEHVVLKGFQSGGDLLAKELVYYADKRVMHDRIVTVAERVADLIIRYGTTEERIQSIRVNSRQVCQIEVKISRFVTVDLQKIIDGIDPNSSPRHWLQT